MSSLAELQKTQFQLQTVEASLRLDPNNADLKTLAADLREARCVAVVFILFI